MYVVFHASYVRIRFYLNVPREAMNTISHSIVCCFDRIQYNLFHTYGQFCSYFLPRPSKYSYNIFILSLVGIWFDDSSGRGGMNDVDDDMHFGIWSNCRCYTNTCTHTQ